ncbi:acyclic terpene utilization AtuA family protein [Ralstonia wenshanensis]|uniref:acyclic terpene utilization AtuA family protein n=1 Tax=Ralstonia wenshanensis TaxID=2842456 RepID=UPI002AADC7C2|nr:acyclic terpene utilization AtuA family protein [Ralstonia wenshanensis]MDY7508255.1 acyclic terpene utilization AtuA family protein [Ralstonia wenshanensis]
MRKDTVSIGGASGFWGDSITGPMQLVASGRLDFLVFDYLAELTMSLLASARMKNPELGYATDFVSVAMRAVLKDALAQNIRIIANAGGVNPRGCATALQALADELGVSVRIAVVEGDDVMPLLPALRDEGVRELQSGRPVPDKVVSANAYLGALPIKAALDAGAQVVITGRCVDSAVTLGALMHHFDWAIDDYDRLAAGSLAGHILECGCQGAGGLHTDWEAVPDWAHSGYPIAECRADGSFIVTKPDGTGGLVTPATVGEQLLYEIGDPARYVLPDVVCDFTQVTMTQAGKHRVEVRGARGLAPTPDYKVSATYADGYRATGQLTVVGIDADRKAHRTAEAILERTRGLFRQLGLPDYSATHIETLGSAFLFGPHQPNVPRFESVMWLAVMHPNKQALELFAREIAPAGTSWAPGTTGAGGRPSVVPAIKQYAFLIDKARVQPRVTLLGEEGFDIAVPTGGAALEASAAAPASVALQPGPTREVPLIELAYARSGDKGDTSNIGVIARRPEDLPLLRAQLTAEAVAAYLAHVVKGRVTRYDLPGIHALNFVCGQALGGGGMASLRNDPLGKGMAQVLLTMPVRVPVDHS